MLLLLLFLKLSALFLMLLSLFLLFLFLMWFFLFLLMLFLFLSVAGCCLTEKASNQWNFLGRIDSHYKDKEHHPYRLRHQQISCEEEWLRLSRKERPKKIIYNFNILYSVSCHSVNKLVDRQALTNLRTMVKIAKLQPTNINLYLQTTIVILNILNL